MKNRTAAVQRVMEYRFRVNSQRNILYGVNDGNPMVALSLYDTEYLTRKFDGIRRANGLLPFLPSTPDEKFDDEGRYLIWAEFTKIDERIELEVWAEVQSHKADDVGTMYKLPMSNDELMVLKLSLDYQCWVCFAEHISTLLDECKGVVM